MKKSKKTIIYMLIALVVAVSVVFVDYGKCFAVSGEGFASMNWRWFKYDDSEKSSCSISCPHEVVDYDSYIGLDYKDVSVLSGSDSLTCKSSVYNVYSEYGQSRANVFSFGSSSEIVAVLATCNDFSKYFNVGFSGEYLCLWIVSKSNMKYVQNFSIYLDGSWKINTSLATNGWFWNDIYTNSSPDSNDNYYCCYRIPLDNKTYSGVSLSDDVKFFDDASSAYAFIDSGDTSGVVSWDNSPKQTYSPELAFTSFDMSVHDSNSFDDYYIDFVYKCPDSWLGKDVKLVVNQTWDYNVYYFDIKETGIPLSLQGSNQRSLSISDTCISFYLKDLKCFDEFLSQNALAGASSFQKRRILGEGDFSESFSLGGVPIKGSASTIVDKSFLSLSCVVYVDGVAGHEYLGSLDLVSGDNSMSTYTPDSGGNYTYNNDRKKGGRYYTDLGKDAAGNTTYNYYYYNTDNSKHEVSSKDSHDNTYTTTEETSGGGSASGDNSNNNVNNPTFNNNNNITIEGDTINNDVSNIVGSNTSTETNKNFIEKFLGFFQLLENNSFLGVWGKVFGWLPPGISSVITTALGIGACVGLFRFFRR